METPQELPVSGIVNEEVSRDYLLRVANTFLRLDHIMGSITDLRQLLMLIMMEAEKLASAETSSLLLYDEAANELFFELALGPKGDKLKEVRLAMDQGIAGYAASKRIAVNVKDAQNDPRFFRQADKTSTFVTRNLVAVPMLRKDRLIGILEVLNKKGDGYFSDEDVQILQVLAGQAAIAIENARLFEANMKAERLAAIGEAIAGLSHYIKNIVTGMQGSASLVEAALNEKRYDMLPRAWEILKRSTDKVSTLIQDMLTYSKDRKLEKVETDLRPLVQELIDLNAERASNLGVELKFQHDDRLQSVWVDPKSFEDCVLNLINNALDAMESSILENGGTGRLEVVTRLLESGTQWQLAVADNGCGIPEDKLGRVFDAFFSTKGSRGTGLGLAVVSKMIREHGGKIDVQSKVGVGTTFTITMPAAP